MRFILVACLVLPVWSGISTYDQLFYQNTSEFHVPTQRRTAEADDLINYIRVWVNWNQCTYSLFNISAVPTNDFAPNNTLFITSHQVRKIGNIEYCNPPFIQKANISVGMQTIILALDFYNLFDYSDDWELGRENCPIDFAETEDVRYREANTAALRYNDKAFKEKLYVNIDNVSVDPIFINDDGPYFLEGCPDNRTLEKYSETLLGQKLTGDPCDAVPWEPLSGLDSYPNAGWFYIDTREWTVGDVHTYEFGSLQSCLRGHYIVTAV